MTRHEAELAYSKCIVDTLISGTDAQVQEAERFVNLFIEYADDNIAEAIPVYLCIRKLEIAMTDTDNKAERIEAIERFEAVA